MSNTRVTWMSPQDPPESFPPVESALIEPDGLLAAGGDLGQERLLYAYRNGIFPWFEAGQPILWWSPDPRCVFLPGDYHVSRRFRRELKRGAAEIRINTAFSDVIRHCAGPRRSEQGTWITNEMVAAYENLHRSGWAHSVEVWHAGDLIGGLYGVAIGKAFFGESMFSKRSNASKIALLFMANRLDEGDFHLLDCQVESAHLTGLGARVIPRSEFTASLDTACRHDLSRRNWPDTPLACSELFVE